MSYTMMIFTFNILLLFLYLHYCFFNKNDIFFLQTQVGQGDGLSSGAVPADIMRKVKRGQILVSALLRFCCTAATNYNP